MQIPILTVFIASLYASTAWSQIVPIERLSRVEHSDTFQCLICPEPETTVTSEETQSFGSFDESVRGASQTSSFGVDTIEVAVASSPGLAGSEFGSLSTSSVFEILFDIETSASYDLTGILDINLNPGPPGFPGGRALVSLEGPDTSLLVVTPDFDSTTGLDFQGDLLPGQYTFRVSASGSSSVIEQAADTLAVVSLTLTAIPEPSSTVFLLASASGFALRNRKRRVS